METFRLEPSKREEDIENEEFSCQFLTGQIEPLTIPGFEVEDTFPSLSLNPKNIESQDD